MKTKSGHLYMTKTEIKEMEQLINHVERDFRDATREKMETKVFNQVANALENLKWILENAIN